MDGEAEPESAHDQRAEHREGKPRASILIANWNTRDDLDACLRSIRADATAGDVEIVVVDNASTDGTADHVRSRFPEVRLVESPTNLGFGAACNRAAAVAASPTWLLLNPDTEVRPGAVGRLLDALVADAGAGAVAPRLLNSDGTLQASCSRRPTVARELARLLHLGWIRGCGYDMASWSLDQSREVDVAAGACLAVRSAALAGDEPFDESFFMYSEEVDLCERLRRGGWNVLWVPDAEVVHHGGASSRQAEAAMFLELYRGKTHFFRKHGGALSVAAYKAVLLLAAAARLLLAPLVLLEDGDRRRRHLWLAGRYAALIPRLPRL